jgi:hypothetical protein
MKTIKFSHRDYEKFRRIDRKPPFTARLLQVFLLHQVDVTDAFTEYDTKFYTENSTEYYVMQSQLWIVLLFEADNGLLFTTLRSANTSKLQYYRNAQSDHFLVTVVV